MGPDQATIVVFLLNGIIHTLVTVPFTWSWSNVLPVAFLCFGILTVISRRLGPLLHQNRWPVPLNVLINCGLVVLGFHVGYAVERMLVCGW